ncbi:hypothetical protein GGF41_002269 [Coemansia sp. RSA 2531]|nr:hypothetical protein GGF41_002269 [Coemansia sp. RSA 2531]
MARFSCCGLVRKSINLASLILILTPLAVLASLLVTLLVLTFKAPTIAPAKVYYPGEYRELTYSLVWQEPFAYEAKVYASLSPITPNKESFFETAQLLWHIEPQQLTNRYPSFSRKVNVHIPSQLRSSPSAGHGLYVHMFVQQAGRFNPHPDFTDPFLVSRAIPVVRWSNGTSKSVEAMSSAAPNDEHDPELLGVSSASWAIVLENHTYSWHSTPSYLQLTLGYSNTGFYSPPLFANTYTKWQPEEKPLAMLKDKHHVADVYPQTIDVELELSGIRQSWISAKKGLTNLLVNKTPIVIETTVPDPLNPEQSMPHLYTDWVEDDALITPDVAHRLSVPALTYLAMCFALMLTIVPFAIRLVVRLWSTSISRWIGVSRATVAIVLIGSTIYALWIIPEGEFMWILFQPVLIFTIVIAAKLDDVTFAPWVVLSQLCRKLFRRKPLPDIARSSSAQQLSLIAENKDELDSTSDNAESNPYFRRPEPVIAIRREVDDISMYWIHLLTLPVIAMSALYMLVDQKGKFWSWEFIEGVFTWSSRVVFSVAWLPQIIVNYKTKSGSLTPVTLNLLILFASVLGTIFTYLTGSHTMGGITVDTFPSDLCNAIIILQRIVYHKRTKQD